MFVENKYIFAPLIAILCTCTIGIIFDVFNITKQKIKEKLNRNSSYVKYNKNSSKMFENELKYMTHEICKIKGSIAELISMIENQPVITNHENIRRESLI